FRIARSPQNWSAHSITDDCEAPICGTWRARSTSIHRPRSWPSSRSTGRKARWLRLSASRCCEWPGADSASLGHSHAVAVGRSAKLLLDLLRRVLYDVGDETLEGLR